MSKIRVLAIALLKNPKGQILLHQGYDSAKKQVFYRPLGGGVDFSETAKVALKREFQEELGKKIKVKKLVGVFENIFTYENKDRHEIVFVYTATFSSLKDYKKAYEIIEDKRVVGKAVWRTLKDMRKEKAPFYPAGLEQFI